jgi:hypothetical protein
MITNNDWSIELYFSPKVYDKTIGKVKSTLSAKPEKKDPASTADEISELKKRLAEVEAKLKAAENHNTEE